ncbi:MAG: hypothetical protein ETSY2_45405 [Candidatus Entotheonella gemina]|uniref:ATPase AAA-type core domain-containing protein n=1 Tax=Candidatus Entotheonella gemina TaxID=1429439 RepID=W4LI41_9BACT|nr:MAG: hypothetical protein ETSY2_45405 [Candidatus Entotheonella gemina]
MKPTITLSQKELSTFLLNVAVVRPVFIWGPPGIGKSSLVISLGVKHAVAEASDVKLNHKGE